MSVLAADELPMVVDAAAVPLDDRAVLATAEKLSQTWDGEREKLKLFEDYYRGEHRKPSFSARAERAYGGLWEASTVNYMQLVVHTVAQRLAVDGYRASREDADNATPWRLWQANGMDARQKPFYLEVGKFGYGYVAIVPVDQADGSRTARIRPLSPMHVFADYVDPDDDWPLFVLQRDGDVAVLWDANFAYHIDYSNEQADVVQVAEHGVGVPPFVRFDNTLNLACGCPHGEIEPLIPLQNQINRISFVINLIAEKASFAIKWLAGIDLPEDENGDPINPFRSAPDETWVFADANAKAGEFSASNPGPIVDYRQRLLQDLFSQAQIPPHYGDPDLANISAEALLALEKSLEAKINDRQTLLGEAWEKTLRLAAAIAGDEVSATDESSQVWWRDVSPRSLAQVVDAGGKAVATMGVPQEATWLWIPGTTRQTVEDWRALKARESGRATLQSIVQRVQNEQPDVTGAEPTG